MKKRHDKRGKREENYSCMLLGNNLWSLKAANMADLALRVFHFGVFLLLRLPNYCL